MNQSISCHIHLEYDLRPDLDQIIMLKQNYLLISLHSIYFRQVMSRCLNLEPHRRPTTAQLLCDPIIHKKMLLTYADIGAYKPRYIHYWLSELDRSYD